MSQADNLKELRDAFAKYNRYIIDAYTKAMNVNADYQEFTVSAAFLGISVSWEHFLEKTFIDYMLGNLTISGKTIKCYVNPTSVEHARPSGDKLIGKYGSSD
jgi:hypothetical protein